MKILRKKNEKNYIMKKFYGIFFIFWKNESFQNCSTYCEFFSKSNFLFVKISPFGVIRKYC